MKLKDRFKLWNAHRKWWKEECRPYKPKLSLPFIEIVINKGEKK